MFILDFKFFIDPYKYVILYWRIFTWFDIYLSAVVYKISSTFFLINVWWKYLSYSRLLYNSMNLFSSRLIVVYDYLFAIIFLVIEYLCTNCGIFAWIHCINAIKQVAQCTLRIDLWERNTWNKLKHLEIVDFMPINFTTHAFKL